MKKKNIQFRIDIQNLKNYYEIFNNRKWFSGLSAAAYLSKKGYKVEVYEKNSIGGRARKLKYKGYTFDMGPSWYWMPGI